MTQLPLILIHGNKNSKNKFKKKLKLPDTSSNKEYCEGHTVIMQVAYVEVS